LILNDPYLRCVLRRVKNFQRLNESDNDIPSESLLLVHYEYWTNESKGEFPYYEKNVDTMMGLVNAMEQKVSHLLAIKGKR
jgi:hypothetical protein